MNHAAWRGATGLQVCQTLLLILISMGWLEAWSLPSVSRGCYPWPWYIIKKRLLNVK